MKSLEQKQILCVDDSQDNRELSRFILSEEGYEVRTAGSVAEGVQVAQSGEFGLYLIDLSFPDGTGFELMEQIRGFDPATPIVICCSNARESVQVEALRAGAKAFLLRPIDPDLLLQTVAALWDPS